MMVSKRESPIPGVSFSGSFWLNFGGSMFFVRKICTHRTIHRRITGSFQALPGSEGVGSAASGGGEIFQRWWPLEHDHKMDEKNLKDVISSDSRLMILYFLQVVRHLKFNYFYGNIYGELKKMTRWWFQIFCIFIPIWGRWTHFDDHICSKGLVQPPARWAQFTENFH